jgi:hypothetical protein
MATQEIIPFNFDDIYTKVETKFADKGYDVFDGSNTSHVITAMAYLTSMLNANTAININEMILPLAEKRENVIHDARLLGYEPSYIKSYRYRLVLEFAQVGNYIINRFDEFATNAKLYYYMGDTTQIITITQNMIDTNTNTYQIEVIEGALKRYTDPLYSDILNITTGFIKDSAGLDIPQYYVDVPFKNVENDGIYMYLDYIDSAGNSVSDERWRKSDRFMIDKDTTLNKKFIRLDNIDFKIPRAYFKLSGVGNDIRPGSSVKINLIISSGTDGEMTTIPTTTIANATVQSYTLESKGSSEETIEDIKTHAPLFYNTAARSVTADDYKVISERNTSVYSAEIWGGEDEYPVMLGNLYFSFVPESLHNGGVAELRNIISSDITTNKIFALQDSETLNKYFLTNDQMSSNDINNITGEIYNPGVIDYINEYKLPALKLNIRHPMYIDVYLDVNVIKYVISKSRVQTRQEIFDIINAYMIESEKFYLEFFTSNITKRIDSKLSDISGLELKASFKTMITSKNIQTEDLNLNTSSNGLVVLQLSSPYEDIYDTNGDLIYENLPVINTVDLFSGVNLSVDYTSFSFTNGVAENGHEVIEFDIIVTDRNVTPNLKYVSGKYKIYNLKKQSIVVELFVKMNSSSTYTTVDVNNTYFTSASFDTPKYLDLKYKTSNFRFNKNTIPRLKQVTFN